MKCQAKNRECEFAADLSLIDQNTGKERRFTICHAGHEGKPCPYYWYTPNIEDAEFEDIE